MNEWTIPALVLFAVIMFLTVLPILLAVVKGRRKRRALNSDLSGFSPYDMMGARTLGMTRRDRYRLTALAAFLCVMYFLAWLDNQMRTLSKFLFLTGFVFILAAGFLVLAVRRGSLVVTDIGLYRRSIVEGDRLIRWADVKSIVFDEERRGYFVYTGEDVMTGDDEDEQLGIQVPAHYDGLEDFVRISLKMVPADRWEGQSYTKARAMIGD